MKRNFVPLPAVFMVTHLKDLALRWTRQDYGVRRKDFTSSRPQSWLGTGRHRQTGRTLLYQPPTPEKQAIENAMVPRSQDLIAIVQQNE